MKKFAIVALAGAVAFGMTACTDAASGTEPQTVVVCEHDATDQIVEDSFCEAGLDGYEWDEVTLAEAQAAEEEGLEIGGLHKKKKHKVSNLKPKSNTSKVKPQKKSSFGSSNRSSGKRK